MRIGSISGSLTQLNDGTSYLVAGTNITITSASNGPITIDAAGGSPGGSDTEIQYNGSGAFTGSNNFTFNGSSLNLTGSFHISGSVTQGPGTFATGEDSFAHGLGDPNNYGDLTASGNYSHAEGESTTASGIASHSEGQATTASGDYSHAEGAATAIGLASHAEGENTQAGLPGFLSNDISSTVQDEIVLEASYGDVTGLFSGQTAIVIDTPFDNVIGYKTYSVNSTSFNGTNTILAFSTTIPLTTTAVIGIFGDPNPSGADQILGSSSHAEGGGTITAADYSHAEGSGTVAAGEGSHAEGGSGGGGTLVASGQYSHAEGYNTLASGSNSHAEGYSTIAAGYSSHAEGSFTVAIGSYSHAEGVSTIAFADYSHAEGEGTIASGSYQHAGGMYNIRGNDFSLFVIGNGTSDADVDRSDVLRINSGSIGDGRVEVTGSLAATTGLSGSLTQLVDGTSYLIAGSNITITSASNGAVTIDATGGSASYQLNMFAGTISSTAASASMESIGMDYFDISKVPGGATSYVFKAILATTAGTTAYMDLYDYNGIVSGIPGPISGSVLTGSNQSYTYLTADITTALSAVTGSGIIEARIWCDPTGLNLNAISKNAKLEIV